MQIVRGRAVFAAELGDSLLGKKNATPGCKVQHGCHELRRAAVLEIDSRVIMQVSANCQIEFRFDSEGL